MTGSSGRDFAGCVSAGWVVAGSAKGPLINRERSPERKPPPPGPSARADRGIHGDIAFNAQ